MNNAQQQIIESYRNSFVEDYDEWKIVLSSVNKDLYMYLNNFEPFEDQIEISNLEPFTYTELCVEYIKHIERYFEDFETLNENAIAAIFEVMIILKISNTSKTPNVLIEKFLV